MFSTKGLRARTGFCSLPHPQNLKEGGEDSFFVSNMTNGIAGVGGGWGWRSIYEEKVTKATEIRPTVLGIADGVRGWSEEDSGSGIFSNALMASCCDVATYSKRSLEPIGILSEGYRSIRSVEGSSTACIVSIGNGKITSSNLGDSGFMLIRDGKIAYRTKEQVHRFSTPYQIGTHLTDQPNDSILHETLAESGDILILGTNGLFNNMFDEDIIEHITEEIEEGNEWTLQNLFQISSSIATEAFETSRTPRGETPFSQKAAVYGYKYSGGKVDDITVMVTHIS